MCLLVLNKTRGDHLPNVAAFKGSPNKMARGKNPLFHIIFFFSQPLDLCIFVRVLVLNCVMPFHSIANCVACCTSHDIHTREHTHSFPCKCVILFRISRPNDTADIMKGLRANRFILWAAQFLSHSRYELRLALVVRHTSGLVQLCRLTFCHLFLFVFVSV